MKTTLAGSRKVHIGFTLDSPWIHQRLVELWSPQPTLHVGMDMRITLTAFATVSIGVSEFRRIFYAFSKTLKLPIAKATGAFGLSIECAILTHSPRGKRPVWSGICFGAQRSMKWCAAKHQMVRTKTFDGAQHLNVPTVSK